jgi:hypothetical protein
MLSLPEKPEFDHAASLIYYKVADIQAGFQTLSSRGAHFEGEPHLIARTPDHDLGFVSSGTRRATCWR